MNNLVSVILPCYKAEMHLRRMLECVLEQTYNNWELLIVSNGPESEKQVEIANGYARTDSRIRVIHTDELGLSNARNIGIDNANGDWIVFVDADDRIERYHLQNFMDVADDDSEMVVMGFKMIKHGSESMSSVRSFDSKCVQGFNGFQEACKLLLSFYGATIFVWNKMFSSSFLGKNLRFDKSQSNYEDEIFCLDVLKHVNRIQLIDKNSYVYITANENNTSSRYHASMEESVIQIESAYEKLFDRLNLPYDFAEKKRNTDFYIHRYLLVFNLYKKNCTLSVKEKVAMIKRWVFSDEFKETQRLYKTCAGNWATKLFDCGTMFNSAWFMYYYMWTLIAIRNSVARYR